MIFAGGTKLLEKSTDLVVTKYTKNIGKSFTRQAIFYISGDFLYIK